MSKRLTNFIVQKNKDLTALETFKATNKASLIEWKTNDHLHNDGSQSNGISSLLNGTISALKPAAENAAA